MKKFLTTAFLFTLAVAAFAQAPGAAPKSLFEGQFLAHIALAIAAAGCGMAQGKAVAAACEGIARNPQAAGNIRCPKAPCWPPPWAARRWPARAWPERPGARSAAWANASNAGSGWTAASGWPA